MENRVSEVPTLLLEKKFRGMNLIKRCARPLNKNLGKN